MKKLLLSSIIMFAVCGYASAQNATGSKFKQGATTQSAAPTPQKAAVVNTEESIKTEAPASDKAAQSAVVTPAPTGKAAQMKAAQAKVNRSEEIGADGTVTDAAAQKKAEEAKIAADKAERSAGKKNN